MKRIASFIMVVVLLCAATTTASARVDYPESSRFVYIYTESVSLSINGNTGTASCNAKCYATSSNLTVQLVGKLQQKYGGVWHTIASWNNSGSYYASLHAQRPVTYGYNYRFVVNIYILDSNGHILETDTINDEYNYGGT